MFINMRDQILLRELEWRLSVELETQSFSSSIWLDFQNMYYLKNLKQLKRSSFFLWLNLHKRSLNNFELCFKLLE